MQSLALRRQVLRRALVPVPHDDMCTYLCLLSASLLALLLLLRVSENAKRARDLAGLDGGEALAEVLGELLDKGRVKARGLVTARDSDDDVAAELGKVVLRLRVRRDDGLERRARVDAHVSHQVGRDGQVRLELLLPRLASAVLLGSLVDQVVSDVTARLLFRQLMRQKTELTASAARRSFSASFCFRVIFFLGGATGAALGLAAGFFSSVSETSQSS